MSKPAHIEKIFLGSATPIGHDHDVIRFNLGSAQRYIEVSFSDNGGIKVRGVSDAGHGRLRINPEVANVVTIEVD